MLGTHPASRKADASPRAVTTAVASFVLAFPVTGYFVPDAPISAPTGLGFVCWILTDISFLLYANVVPHWVHCISPDVLRVAAPLQHGHSRVRVWSGSTFWKDVIF